MSFWISLAGYQLVWFAAVIGAGHGHAWPALLAVALYAAWQLATARRYRTDLTLVVAALVLGSLFDGAMLRAGLLGYATEWPSTGFAPAWILALWVAFALTFSQSLAWLKGRPWLAAWLGGVGGPLAYLGAARGWAVVTFAPPAWHGLLCLAIGWAVATPLLAWLAGARRWRASASPTVVARGAP